jgi:hypothetical protein
MAVILIWSRCEMEKKFIGFKRKKRQRREGDKAFEDDSNVLGRTSPWN